MKDIAVVMTAWRRPYYLKQVLEGWRDAAGVADLGKFAVALEPSDKQDEMLETIWQSGLPVKVDVTVNPQRLGVLVNPVESITRVFNESPEIDFVVAAEEDILGSRDVLAYFDWAKTEFKADPSVLLVCAHQRKEGTDPSLVHLTDDFAPWLWGTWRDRWFKVLQPTWDRDYTSGQNDPLYPEAGWDWHIHRRVIPRGNFRTVLPDQTRSQNLGKLEGVHADPSAWAGTQVASFKPDQTPVSYHLASQLLKLNLGCGSVQQRDYVNVDVADIPGVDVVHDLDVAPWPFEDASAEEIIAFDIFEHVNDPLTFMNECGRVLAPRGLLKLHTTHWKSPNAYTDPTHKRFPTERTFDYWVPGTELHTRYGAAYVRNGAEFKKVKLYMEGTEMVVILRRL